MRIVCTLLLMILIIALPLKPHAQDRKGIATIIVAQDGSGNFKTIQEAINSVRDLSPLRVTINIRAGVYHEKIIVSSSKSNITLKGDNAATTVISNADYSDKPLPGGTDAAGHDKFSTFNSYTLLVQGNDFTAEDLTIENASGKVGQAVALDVESDRCIFKNCRLLGNQDTLYAANDTSRQYYQNCWIEGTTDFIFGSATAVFDGCTIKSLANSYITAASTSIRQPFGYVFLHCKLIAGDGVSKVYLGRPWRANARVVFAYCDMASHINPLGWHNWNNPANERTAFYAEYQNAGPGAAIAQRVAWSKQLTNTEIAQYTVKNIFAGTDQWDPQETVHGQ